MYSNQKKATCTYSCGIRELIKDDLIPWKGFQKNNDKVAAGQDRRDSVKIIFCLFCLVKYPPWQNSQWVLIVTIKQNSVNGDLSLQGKKKKKTGTKSSNTQCCQCLSQMLTLYPFPGLPLSFQIYWNYSPGATFLLLSKVSSFSMPFNLSSLRSWTPTTLCP